MDNLIFSANVVIPLLAVMLAGYIARKLNIIGDKAVSECNSLVFKMFLPIHLFNSTRNATADEISNIGFFIFVIVFIVLFFILSTITIIPLEKDNRKRGVMVQGICRSNYAMFGLPMITLLLPQADLSLASVLVAVVIPTYNVLSVIVLTYFGSKKADIRSIVIAIIKNPLIIATAIGVTIMQLDFTLPKILDTSFINIGSIATPFALFMLGAKFDFSELKRIGRQLWIVCFGRLIIIPLIVMSVAVLFGYRATELACVMVVFASPTAASSYVMAEKMGGDGDLASSIVVFTNAISIITMFLIIYTIKTLGFI